MSPSGTEAPRPVDDDAAFRRGQVGLREAMARFEQTLQVQLIDHTAIAAAEATLWACSLDELRWTRDGYEQARDADLDGRVLNGLRWARNQGAHQIVNPQS